MPHRDEAPRVSKSSINQKATMYKKKVQELCYKLSWSLPNYETNSYRPPHNLRFTSTVTNNIAQTHSSEPTETAKEAQNNAAKVAFDHFSQLRRQLLLHYLRFFGIILVDEYWGDIISTKQISRSSWYGLWKEKC